MQKTILITGATDGIGFETAKKLLAQGHRILLHGRSPEKLRKVEEELSALGSVESYIADLSDMKAVMSLAQAVAEKHQSLDVLINNAGLLQAPNALTEDRLDIRFVVNTIAPYLLTKELLPLLSDNGRVINLSSAAQSPVDVDALSGKKTGLEAMEAYSQSKLALTMWTRALAKQLGKFPAIIAVNPGSLLGSKMVKEGFGIEGKDIGIGADILIRAALSDEFADKTGLYFDNDSGQFTHPHPDALDDEKCQSVIAALENILNEQSYS
jgi:NAD(P)-dependent dehydrogenase (short-subunit alcohol dehydrogenase family)